MSEFLKVVTVQEALEILADFLPQRGIENISLCNALGRITAESVFSPEAVPAFSRSTVDGYAVLAQDTFGCSESLPSFLSYHGEVPMGEAPDFAILPGQCCWIPTGGMLPEGSDAAVMVEYTERLAHDTVLIYKPAGPGDNVMQKGEDAPMASLLIPAGHRLRAQDIGLLASVGVSQVKVYQPYRVGIISTGNELVEINTCPRAGQIRDVNSLSLAAAVKAAGGVPASYPIVPDDKSLLKETVSTALQDNDWILMSGGSSIGIMDNTLDVLMDLPDARLLFHGIAVKPGKPTMAVAIGSKLVVGLPGHPVSALTMFNVVCQPYLSLNPARHIRMVAGANIASQAGRDDYIPVYLEEVDQQLVAQPLLGKSGLMTVLSKADGYIHIEYQQQGINRGELVKVIMYE